MEKIRVSQRPTRRKKIGIYKIVNPKNQIYIGQSVDIERRFSYYKRFKCNSQPKLYNSLRKYGIENHLFEILTECDIDKLNEMERYYQELFNVIKQGLNCMFIPTINGRGQMSQETKDKIAKSNTGKVVSAETRLKLRNCNLGKEYPERRKPKLPRPPRKPRVVPQELRERIRQSLLGRKRPEYIGKLTGGKLKGRKLSEETKKKISENSSRWNLGISPSKETKRKISLNNKMKRCVKDTVSGKTYDSILIAANSIGIGYQPLRNMLNGRQKNKTTIIYT